MIKEKKKEQKKVHVAVNLPPKLFNSLPRFPFDWTPEQNAEVEPYIQNCPAYKNAKAKTDSDPDTTIVLTFQSF